MRRVLCVLAVSCLALGAMAQNIVPEQLEVTRLKLKNYTFCYCLSLVYSEYDSLWIKDGSGGGYFETGAYGLAAYDSVGAAALSFLSRQVYSSKDGEFLGLMKCLDFYNSRELDELVRRLDTETDSARVAASYAHWIEVHDESIESTHPNSLTRSQGHTGPASSETARLADVWHLAHSAGVFVLADSLFDIMISDPNRFFAAMKTDRAGFDWFVGDLQYTVFTNQNDTVTAALEQKRTNTIELLQKVQIKPEYSRMFQAVIKALEEIRPRVAIFRLEG
jgi:hypothetical protein